LAAETRAPTTGDNGTVASIGWNGVNSEGGGGGGDDGSSASNVTGSVGVGSEGGSGGGANGSDFIAEKSLSGCVLTISLDAALGGLAFFCELTEGF
jgi:hypothetical protein